MNKQQQGFLEYLCDNIAKCDWGNPVPYEAHAFWYGHVTGKEAIEVRDILVKRGALEKRFQDKSLYGVSKKIEERVDKQIDWDNREPKYQGQDGHELFCKEVIDPIQIKEFKKVAL